jgi:hypothetical protein
MADNSQKTAMVDALNRLGAKTAQDRAQIMPKNVPAHVVKVTDDFVEIAFDLLGPYTLPNVKVPQNFSKYVREPTQVGDKGYVTSGDFSLGGSSGDAGGIASAAMRGNLGPLSFQPISQKTFPKRNVDQLTMTGGPAGVHASTADGTSAVLDMAGSVISHKVQPENESASAVESILNPLGLHVTGPAGTQITLNGHPIGGSGGEQGPPGPEGPAGPTGPQGPPGIVWMGAWAVGVEYHLNNGVAHNGSSYICIRENFSSIVDEPPNATYWNVLALEGAIGPRGPAGPTGPQGIQGPEGPTGPRGPQGIEGPEGPQGLQGPEGPEGPQGPQGIQGPEGPQGPQGIQGPEGPQGPQGIQGPEGPQGPQGATGPQGIQGETGPQGIEGPEGPAGRSTTIVGDFGQQTTPADLPPDGFIPTDFDGPGRPTTAYQMQIGQSLIYDAINHQDPDFGDLFTYVGTVEDEAGWANVGHIQGPQGPQGIQGPEGPQGPQGATGPQGIQGEMGPQGIEGPEGPQGIQGPEGPEGPQGPQGIQGPEGPQGPQGATGPAGASSQPAGVNGDIQFNNNGVFGGLGSSGDQLVARSNNPAFTGVVSVYGSSIAIEGTNGVDTHLKLKPTTDSREATVQFYRYDGPLSWSVGKQVNSSFQIYDGTGLRSILTCAPNGVPVFPHGLTADQAITVEMPWAALFLNKPASGTGTFIQGRMANRPRWVMYLGDNTPEVGSGSGSNFSILRYNDAGVLVGGSVFSINRASGVVSTQSLKTSDLTLDNPQPNFVFHTSTDDAYVSVSDGDGNGGQTRHLFIKGMDQGNTVQVNLANFHVCAAASDFSGHLNAEGAIYATSGYRVQCGPNRGPGANSFNWWFDSTNGTMQGFIDDTFMGNLPSGLATHLRANVQPAPSTFALVQAVDVVTYDLASDAPTLYSEMTRRRRFGFNEAALRMRDARLVSAGDNNPQVDLISLVAMLTNTLKEATQRIEALEAQVAALSGP